MHGKCSVQPGADCELRAVTVMTTVMMIMLSCVCNFATSFVILSFFLIVSLPQTRLNTFFFLLSFCHYLGRFRSIWRFPG